jgi:chromosome segregation ATPase
MRCTYLKKKKKVQKIDLQTRIGQLQNHNGLLEKCLEKKTKKLEREVSEKSEIKNRNTFLENRILCLENEQSNFQIQVVSLEDEKSDLHSRVAVLENENSDLHKRVQDLEKCDREHQKLIFGLKKETSEHQKHVAALENEVSQHLKQMEVARPKLKVEDHLLMNVRILLEDSFFGHQVLVKLS